MCDKNITLQNSLYFFCTGYNLLTFSLLKCLFKKKLTNWDTVYMSLCVRERLFLNTEAFKNMLVDPYLDMCDLRNMHFNSNLQLIEIWKNWIQIFPEDIQPCNMKNRNIYWRRYKIQETVYVGQWHLSPFQNRQLGNSHGSLSRHQLPHHIAFSWISSMVWNLFYFKGEFSFGESQKSQGAKSGL